MEVNQLRKMITQHVREHCSLIYDDPQTGQENMCKHPLMGHCIAIDNPLYHADKGMSMCKWFNTLPPMQGAQQGTAKACMTCNKSFTPTSNRQRVCVACGKIAAKRAARERQQKARQNVTV